MNEIKYYFRMIPVYLRAVLAHWWFLVTGFLCGVLGIIVPFVPEWDISPLLWMAGLLGSLACAQYMAWVVLYRSCNEVGGSKVVSLSCEEKQRLCSDFVSWLHRDLIETERYLGVEGYTLLGGTRANTAISQLQRFSSDLCVDAQLRGRVRSYLGRFVVAVEPLGKSSVRPKVDDIDQLRALKQKLTKEAEGLAQDLRGYTI